MKKNKLKNRPKRRGLKSGLKKYLFSRKFDFTIWAVMLRMSDPMGKTIVLTEYHNPVYPKRNYDLGIFPKFKGKVSYE